MVDHLFNAKHVKYVELRNKKIKWSLFRNLTYIAFIEGTKKKKIIRKKKVARIHLYCVLHRIYSIRIDVILYLRIFVVVVAVQRNNLPLHG